MGRQESQGNRGQGGRDDSEGRGFAGMSDEEQRRIAQKGGEASARQQDRDDQGQFAGSGDSGRGGGSSGSQGSGSGRGGSSGGQGGRSSGSSRGQGGSSGGPKAAATAALAADQIVLRCKPRDENGGTRREAGAFDSTPAISRAAGRRTSGSASEGHLEVFAIWLVSKLEASLILVPEPLDVLDRRCRGS